MRGRYWLAGTLACLALLAGAPAAAQDPAGAATPAPADDDAGAGTDPDAADADDADAGDPAPSGPATVPAPDQDATGSVTPVPNPYLDFGFGPAPGIAREPPPPVVVGSGSDALIRAPALRAENDPTLLELYGAQGLSLGQDAPSEDADALGAVAAGLFGVATWLAQAVIAAFQWAFTVEVFAFLGDTVTTIVESLRGLLYTPFVQAAVILAAGSLLWQGMVRRRGTIAVQGMVWIVVALSAAGLFFARPAAIIDGANHLSTGLSRGVLAGVSVADPGSGFDDGVTTVATYEGHPADNQLRVAGDRFWRVFVYEPWLVLQFGDPRLGAPYGERVLASRTITAEEQAEVDGDADALQALVQSKREEATALREEIEADERMAAWFTGRRSVERAGVAMLTLIGVIVGGVLLVLVAAAILLAQIALLLLVLLGPAALLVGIHPGIGRVLAIRWVELAVGVLLRRVALGALLAVVLVLSGVLLEATHPLGWFVVISMQALVVAAAVVYRKPFSRLFAPTTVPALEVDGVRRARRSLQQEAARRLEQWREGRGLPQPAAAGAQAGRVRPAQRVGATDRAGIPAGGVHGDGGTPPRRPRRDPRAEGDSTPAARHGALPAASLRRSSGSRVFVADDPGGVARGEAGNGTAGSAGNGRGPDRKPRGDADSSQAGEEAPP